MKGNSHGSFSDSLRDAQPPTYQTPCSVLSNLQLRCHRSLPYIKRRAAFGLLLRRSRALGFFIRWIELELTVHFEESHRTGGRIAVGKRPFWDRWDA